MIHLEKLLGQYRRGEISSAWLKDNEIRIYDCSQYVVSEEDPWYTWCSRCGRGGHIEKYCKARTNVFGVELSEIY